jgi:uncharacterized protein (DUF1501 family)
MPLSVTRRRFLQGSAAITASAALGACQDDGPPATPARRAAGTLVVVTLAGGNDALNTVAPVDDPTYRSARGALSLDPAGAHALDAGFALHPALVRTKALWDASQLAIVHGVGFRSLDRSHFHCMDVWQAGDTDDLATGWLGRWLDLEGTDPLDAVVVGGNLPLLARGVRRSATVLPAGPFALPGDADLHGRLADLWTADGRSGLEASVARSATDLLAVVDTVTPVVADLPADDTLAARLATVAALIEADLPTRVYAVELGGFDTHADQADTHGTLLAELDGALGDLLERLAAHPVTVLVYSEFGRRVAPNGSGGTDHGSAGTVLVAGNVRAGHHGEPPRLDALVDGDLETTVDFRAVYAGLLEDVIGVEPADVLPGRVKPLHLV